MTKTLPHFHLPLPPVAATTPLRPLHPRLPLVPPPSLQPPYSSCVSPHHHPPISIRRRPGIASDLSSGLLAVGGQDARLSTKIKHMKATPRGKTDPTFRATILDMPRTTTLVQHQMMGVKTRSDSHPERRRD
ncbi:unnamed protein product [Linum trigynum]|uniref:Uncharacterized protein n=1 Tax=Linum trigynum TaxID=586398 RepID=A0AAV2F3I8_9ROSI